MLISPKVALTNVSLKTDEHSVKNNSWEKCGAAVLGGKLKSLLSDSAFSKLQSCNNQAA